MVCEREVETLILGAGTSGLIAGVFYPGSCIIEKRENAGGDFNNKYVPKYLHSDEGVLYLFGRVGLFPVFSKKSVGIFYKNKMFDFNDKSLGEKVVEEYSLKTKNRVDLKSMNRYLIREEDSFISNEDELIHDLSLVSDIKLGEKVIDINLNECSVTTESGLVFTYKRLISTLPINVFCKVAKRGCGIERMNKKIITVKLSDKFFCHDFIYFPEHTYLFNRINVREGYVDFEFTDVDRSEDELNKNIKDFLEYEKIIYNVFISYLQGLNIYLKTSDLILPENVLLLGRFAEGDYSIEIQDVVKKMRRHKWTVS